MYDACAQLVIISNTHVFSQTRHNYKCIIFEVRTSLISENSEHLYPRINYTRYMVGSQI